MKGEIGFYAGILPLLQIVRDRDENKIKEEEFKKHKGCAIKKKYTKKEAKTLINYTRKQGREIRMYECKPCQGWHVTHTGIKIKFFKRRRKYYKKLRKKVWW
ncbi:MAG: hypothetical protein WCO35_00810 [Candidatus Nomurabacteria bacterium]